MTEYVVRNFTFGTPRDAPNLPENYVMGGRYEATGLINKPGLWVITAYQYAAQDPENGTLTIGSRASFAHANMRIEEVGSPTPMGTNHVNHQGQSDTAGFSTTGIVNVRPGESLDKARLVIEFQKEADQFPEPDYREIWTRAYRIGDATDYPDGDVPDPQDIHHTFTSHVWPVGYGVGSLVIHNQEPLVTEPGVWLLHLFGYGTYTGGSADAWGFRSWLELGDRAAAAAAQRFPGNGWRFVNAVSHAAPNGWHSGLSALVEVTEADLQEFSSPPPGTIINADPSDPDPGRPDSLFALLHTGSWQANNIYLQLSTVAIPLGPLTDRGRWSVGHIGWGAAAPAPTVPND